MKLKNATLIAICGSALLILTQVLNIASIIMLYFKRPEYNMAHISLFVPVFFLLGLTCLLIFFINLYNNQK